MSPCKTYHNRALSRIPSSSAFLLSSKMSYLCPLAYVMANIYYCSQQQNKGKAANSLIQIPRMILSAPNAHFINNMPRFLPRKPILEPKRHATHPLNDGHSLLSEFLVDAKEVWKSGFRWYSTRVEQDRQRADVFERLGATLAGRGEH
jgi:hypothetical protein